MIESHVPFFASFLVEVVYESIAILKSVSKRSRTHWVYCADISYSYNILEQQNLEESCKLSSPLSTPKKILYETKPDEYTRMSLMRTSQVTDTSLNWMAYSQ